MGIRAMTQNIGAFTAMLRCALLFGMVTLTSSIILELAKTEFALNTKQGTFNKYGAYFLRHNPSFMTAMPSQAKIPWTSACIFARNLMNLVKMDISTGSTRIIIHAT
uniref:Putative secreted protein n=1 Tax=Ixodes ricinus TaxID=34613 RepID=A0A6B0UE10_IXORI